MGTVGLTLRRTFNYSGRATRTDVYVMDPNSIEIVDSFNLSRPFPTWAEYGDDSIIYIYHAPTVPEMWDDGHQAGITRLDLDTGLELFTPTPRVRYASARGIKN